MISFDRDLWGTSGPLVVESLGAQKRIRRVF